MVTSQFSRILQVIVGIFILTGSVYSSMPASSRVQSRLAINDNVVRNQQGAYFKAFQLRIDEEEDNTVRCYFAQHNLLKRALRWFGACKAKSISPSLFRDELKTQYLQGAKLMGAESDYQAYFVFLFSDFPKLFENKTFEQRLDVLFKDAEVLGRDNKQAQVEELCDAICADDVQETLRLLQRNNKLT